MADEPVRYARYGAAGFDLFGTILAGAGFGYLLDKWLSTSPYLTLILMLIAILVGFIRLIQTLRHFDHLDDGRDT